MKNYLFLILVLILAINVHSQNKDIVIGQRFQIQSKILNEQRQIAIFTPENYASNKESFHVLYVLDGEWNFNFVSSIVDKLMASGHIPNMMVVGLINNNRNKDLTPSGTNDNPNRFGGARLFLRFLTEELQPWINQKYRTHPFSILAGHSFGGLFTVYSMMKRPDAFQSYIALSPSLGRNNEQQLEVATSFFNSNPTLPKSLYIAVANEGGLTYSSSKKFMNLVDRISNKGFDYKFEHLTDENHISISAIGFMNGLKFTYKLMNPDRINQFQDIFSVEKHYNLISEKFGYPVNVPEFYYQKFVREQIAERELDYALFILEKYRKEYPDATQVLMSFADVYLLQGDFKQARNYFLQLKKLGKSNENIEAILQELKN